MAALTKIRQAGFDVALDGDRLKVVGASKLTKEQRMFLKQHKAAVIAELRQEQAKEQEAIPPNAGPVCCGNCRHSLLLPDTDPTYGWRRCSIDVEDGGGFARANRRCAKFARC